MFTVALAVLISNFAGRVDSQLFQLLLQGPAPQGLFSLLDPLQVGLPLFIGLIGGRGPSDTQCVFSRILHR